MRIFFHNFRPNINDLFADRFFSSCRMPASLELWSHPVAIISISSLSWRFFEHQTSSVAGYEAKLRYSCMRCYSFSSCCCCSVYSSCAYCKCAFIHKYLRTTSLAATKGYWFALRMQTQKDEGYFLEGGRKQKHKKCENLAWAPHPCSCSFFGVFVRQYNHVYNTHGKFYWKLASMAFTSAFVDLIFRQLLFIFFLKGIFAFLFLSSGGIWIPLPGHNGGGRKQ